MTPTFPQENPEPPVPPSDTASFDAPGMVETREQFVERALAEYESPLVGYAFGFVHDVERARDIVQDTFIRLCQQDISRFHEGVKTWLFTVCRNRAYDVLRKDKRIVFGEEERLLATATDAPTPDRAADADERHAQVPSAMQRLTSNQREVILLKFHQGLSYQEIAAVTGLGEGNIGFLIHTGLKRLRGLLPGDLLH